MGLHADCPECGSMMREHGNNRVAIADFFVCDMHGENGCGRSWKRTYDEKNDPNWEKLSDW